MRPPRRYSPHANAFGPCATASNLHAAAPTTAAPPPWTAAADRAAWIGSRHFPHFIFIFFLFTVNARVYFGLRAIWSFLNCNGVKSTVD
ncbi:Os04g0456100 [Oryza sativa Japonica Group]|uniref:Os04g0456100 protein n=2 Tax=Oryza TaxID=4527 RepID=Q0JCQ7_ORYSJ|nr:Os04g0456100 [Oryza sativa Japonica Group]|eukprot:NP_001052966.1 Os04g0456100 [Oryza sativa Japonica Group]